jgi:hypothetical protein
MPSALWSSLATAEIPAGRSRECLNFSFGKVSVKMYDKFNRVLRLETTTNNVSFFKHHRKVEYRDGHESREIAPSERPSTA